MLGNPTTERLGLYRQSADGAVTAVYGPVFSDGLAAAATEMQTGEKCDRAGLRKVGNTYLVRIPLSAELAALWLTPAGQPLSAPSIKKLAADAAIALKAPSQTTGKDPTAKTVSALAALPGGTGRRATRSALEAVTDATGWTDAAAIRVRGGRVRSVHGTAKFGDAKDASVRVFAEQMLRADQSLRLEPSRTEPDRPPDVDLFLEAHGITGFAIAMPEGDGLGLYVEGEAIEKEAEGARAALALALEKSPRQRGATKRWPFVLACMIMAVVFLAWPIRFEIGAVAAIEPADSRMVVLDYEARLIDLRARVGEDVTGGASLARFESPLLTEQEKQAALDQMLETLTAQEALAGEDYANYQLAEQRKAIAAFQAEQSRRRLDSLDLKAPEDGRIAFIVSERQVGTLLPAGTPVAEVQIGTDVRARLRISGIDGPLIEPGMTGEVVVRGLVNQSFPIRIIERPSIVTDEAGAQSLSVLADVSAPPEARLLKGLTGYARLDAGTERRIWVWARPVLDFLRLRLWTYLGLHL